MAKGAKTTERKGSGKPPVELILNREKPGIAYRLKLTREALGYSQIKFAKMARLGTSTYNQYERGVNQLPIESANQICDAHKLTLDWIFRGEKASLKREIEHAIDALVDLRDQHRID